MEDFPNVATLLSVASAVIALTIVLNFLVFKPLRRILDERQQRSDEAGADLDEAQAVRAQRLDEIEGRLKEARREAYEIREKAQQAGRDRRDELMQEARQQAHAIVEKTRAEINADIDIARKDLEAEASRLSKLIAERVLGRPVGADRGEPR